MAKDFLEGCGVQFPKIAEAHEKVCWCLSSGSSDADAKLAGIKLTRLRKFRNEADYDLSASASGAFQDARTVRKHLLEAREAADAISLCSVGPDNSAIVQEIREYASGVLRLNLRDI